MCRNKWSRRLGDFDSLPAGQVRSERPAGATLPGMSLDWYELARAAASRLAELTGTDTHDDAVILGSGWGPAAEALGETVTEFPVTELPGFLAPVAPGHPGLVRSTLLDGRRTLVLIGRTHLYEGHGPGAVGHSVRTAAAAGVRRLVLTNANGSFRTDWPIGTGVLIADHLNLSGRSPLVGARFVDLTDCWSRRLRSRAQALNPNLVEGVYAFVPGPHYETAAEAGAYIALGADVIGMSCVLEAIAARELGLDILGLSVVSAIEHDGSAIDPDEVVRAAEAAAARLGHTIAGVLAAD